jgi:cytidine deaminase
MVYCDACGQAALSAKEKCPLCRWPIVRASRGISSGDDGICTICCANQADAIVTPCGHIGYCRECLERWFKTVKSCPLCRTEPASYRTALDWL